MYEVVFLCKKKRFLIYLYILNYNVGIKLFYDEYSINVYICNWFWVYNLND